MVKKSVQWIVWIKIILTFISFMVYNISVEKNKTMKDFEKLRKYCHLDSCDINNCVACQKYYYSDGEFYVWIEESKEKYFVFQYNEKNIKLGSFEIFKIKSYGRWSWKKALNAESAWTKQFYEGENE